MPIALACPSCHADLTVVRTDERACERCATRYRCDRGIWDFLSEERRDAVRQFAVHYSTVRREEGRRMIDPAILRALPFRGPSRKHRYEWAVRARSFEALIRRVIAPLERTGAPKRRILDLGSGVGWLAYRLALRGHDVAAVDVVDDDFGLGVHRHYSSDFVSVNAEFDRLPFAGGAADVVIYNAAFHYASDPVRTLGEALRVLAGGGRIVIMDSPLYRRRANGVAMVQERTEDFARRYGFRATLDAPEGFLTHDGLAALERSLGVRWDLSQPWYGVRWWCRPWVARVRRRRQPAAFKLIVGRRIDPS
jgi:SAM-dependent methyltransferase